MNNKKVILVIILFIGISFIVYSFANPLTEEDEFTAGDGNTGITENNPGNNDNPVIDNTDIVDKDDEKEPNEEPVIDENEGKEDNGANQGSQIAQTTPVSKPTAPKYYCKYVSRKYYGKAGNVVTYSTFVKECDSATPTLTMTKFDGPYTVTLGTSKSLSDFYTSSFGVLGGSVTCKNGNAVIKNLNELKAAGTYTITCEAKGGNGKTTSATIPVKIKPVSNMTPSLGSFTRTSYVYRGITTTNNVSVKQTGNKIYVTGTMLPQFKDTALNTNKYISLNYIGQRQYTAEELANAKFKVNTMDYTNRVTVGTTPAGQSYISIKRGFREGDVFTVTINWGDGNGDYVYEVHYDVKVLTLDEIEDMIDEKLDGENQEGQENA